MKTKNSIPTDYEQLLHLSDIQNWNFKPVIERIIRYKGFYTSMCDGKKTLILP
jgi:hypothetical protein